VSRPTPDQIERFSKLTAEQRFQWLVDTLALCFELATPEARAAWRKHKAGTSGDGPKNRSNACRTRR
jgi:hypothetical protein